MHANGAAQAAREHVDLLGVIALDWISYMPSAVVSGYVAVNGTRYAGGRCPQGARVAAGAIVGNPRGCLGAPRTPLPEDIKGISKIWGGSWGLPNTPV